MKLFVSKSKSSLLWTVAACISGGYCIVYWLFIKARLEDKYNHEPVTGWAFIAATGLLIMAAAPFLAVLFGKLVDKKLAYHDWPCFSVLAGLTVWLAMNVTAMSLLDSAIPAKEPEPQEETPFITTQPETQPTTMPDRFMYQPK